MASPPQTEACMPLLADVATLPDLGWVSSTLSPLAKEFHPSTEWPELALSNKVQACPKPHKQGRIRSLRV